MFLRHRVRIAALFGAFVLLVPAAMLYTVFYNFTRVHKTLRITPAMAAGLTDRVWGMTDIVGLMDAVAPKPGRPVTYKKREAEISN